MAATVLYEGAGPLPITFNFNSPLDGAATLVLNATAWTQSAGTLLEVAVTLDGDQVGSASVCFANQSAVHLTLRPTFIEVPYLSYGAHKIEIVTVGTTTVTDLNDYFQVTLL